MLKQSLILDDNHLDSLYNFEMKSYFAAIEAGGTKFNCAIGTDCGEIVSSCRIQTTTPNETMTQVIQYLQQQAQAYPFAAIGVGCFGPIDCQPESTTYGYITSTPKLAWRDFNIVGSLKAHFDCPIAFDTDVAAAALGEYQLGAGKGCNNLIYFTVGTGIGGAAIIQGNIHHGLIHSEMGHVFLPRDTNRDPYRGICPYHQDCLEGLASGEAIKQRWQVESALELPEDHPAWALEADYLAMGFVNAIWLLSPDKILVGGGVMKQTHLFPMIRERIPKLIAGYLHHPLLEQDIDNFLLPPTLGDQAGIQGAVQLAYRSTTC